MKLLFVSILNASEKALLQYLGNLCAQNTHCFNSQCLQKALLPQLSLGRKL